MNNKGKKRGARAREILALWRRFTHVHDHKLDVLVGDCLNVDSERRRRARLPKRAGTELVIITAKQSQQPSWQCHRCNSHHHSDIVVTATITRAGHMHPLDRPQSAILLDRQISKHRAGCSYGRAEHALAEEACKSDT
eukprot:4212443-Pleurochrysis_carterae.AAC.1